MSEETPRASVVIPTYNKGPETLALSKKCLQSLSRYAAKPLQVIVIDNASPAGCVSSSELDEMGLTDHIILHCWQNAGFAVACNIGFRFARAPYVCQMNTDANWWMMRLAY